MLDPSQVPQINKWLISSDGRRAYSLQTGWKLIVCEPDRSPSVYIMLSNIAYPGNQELVGELPNVQAARDEIKRIAEIFSVGKPVVQVGERD